MNPEHVWPSVLGQVPYFAQLDHAQLEGIASSMQEYRTARGDVLFNEGEACHGLYVLAKGSVKVSRTSPEGREQVLAVIGPIQTFNDVPVFDGGPNPAMATALEPSLVGMVPIAVIRRLLHEHPAVAEGMLRIFASRLRGLAALVADLTHLDVMGRIAKVLLTYEAASGGRTLNVGQQDLASMVGTTREVAARSLRYLEERGAIARRSGGIEVISTTELSSVLGESNR